MSEYKKGDLVWWKGRDYSNNSIADGRPQPGHMYCIEKVEREISICGNINLKGFGSHWNSEAIIPVRVGDEVSGGGLKHTGIIKRINVNGNVLLDREVGWSFNNADRNALHSIGQLRLVKPAEGPVETRVANIDNKPDNFPPGRRIRL